MDGWKGKDGWDDETKGRGGEGRIDGLKKELVGRRKEKKINMNKRRTNKRKKGYGEE